MRIAFAIVSLFPGGGLQRDCLEIAKLVKDFGHEIVIYTSRVHGDIGADHIPIVVLRNNAISNHQRQYIFAEDFVEAIADNFDLVVGFDKLIGIDVLYCADASIYQRMASNILLYLLPRYRTFARIEGESFLPRRKTKVILLSQDQLSGYRRAWKTEPSRLSLLPPTLTPARRRPECRINGTRQELRTQLGLAKNDWVWIAVGVQPKTKGLDRTIRALARFPEARLLIAGLHEASKVSAGLAERARKLGVSSRIRWLGHREDVAPLMSAADLLVHPARYDTTGTVILEAIVNGLPVITTSACGYATHVDAAQAGIIVKSPFEFQMFLSGLDEARDYARRNAWSASGIKYGEQESLYEGRVRAAEIIVASAHEKRRTWFVHAATTQSQPRDEQWSVPALHATRDR